MQKNDAVKIYIPLLEFVVQTEIVTEQHHRRDQGLMLMINTEQKWLFVKIQFENELLGEKYGHKKS